MLQEAIQLYRSSSGTNCFDATLLAGLSVLNQYENDKMTPTDSNLLGALHGGSTCTMVDVTTTLTLMKVSLDNSVSVNLSTEFLNPAKVGDQLRIQNRITKAGKKLAFTECQIFSKEGKMIAKGSHIKAFVGVSQKKTPQPKL